MKPYKTTLKIKGMSCEHCKARVEAALNALDGVTADVDLQNGRAVVFSDRKPDDTALTDTVNALGFSATVSHGIFG